MAARNVQNYINGRFVASSSAKQLEVHNPATGEVIGRVPLSTAAEVDSAVQAAKRAFDGWRRTPPVKRAQHLYKFKFLLEENFETLAKSITTEHGKTLDESRGSLRRAIECVEVAIGVPTLMKGEALEDAGPSIDVMAMRRPLGVFAAITPFNFPVMVPLWFLPFAVATGNTFLLKPSEQVPMSMQLVFELLEKCDFPAGVVNMVNGQKEAVDAILIHPDIKGVSFVGSSPVAQYIYETSAKNGKRVQALGGAKNFLVVMPDADMEKTVSAVVESCYGCAGERCLAGSVVLAVGKAHDIVRDRVLEETKRIRVGNGLEPNVTMGPVISAKHKERVLSYIQKGIDEGAKLLLDGREIGKNENGYFIGPTVFADVDPKMVVAREEIFGPVICIAKVESLEDATKIIESHPLGNTTSIFTSSGKAAPDIQYNVAVSMVGINVGVPAPMAYFGFGGTRGSFFGDTKAHGQESLNFYTDKRVIINRWFS
jgi:malonate-semialdehyde dehydrogenase (acetylating)/methylmalonate-semialdehyde dehydrogenase